MLQQNPQQSSFDSYERVRILPDGNCLFSCIAHQLYGNPKRHEEIRRECMDFIYKNRAHFEGFTQDENLDFDEYIRNMRRTDARLGRKIWGGDVEMVAIGILFGRPFEIWGVRNGEIQRVHSPFTEPAVNLSFILRWSSLRKFDSSRKSTETDSSNPR